MGKLSFKVSEPLSLQERREQLKTIEKEHFNRILFHKSGPADKQHTYQSVRGDHDRKTKLRAKGKEKEDDDDDGYRMILKH